MSKRGTAYDISYEHTTDLLRKARSGSTQAIRELLTIRSKAGDTANKRLRALESAGMTEGSAHERASAYFKETRSGRSFRTGKSLKKITKDLGKGLKELKRDIEELRGFLGSKLSTPTGVQTSYEGTQINKKPDFETRDYTSEELNSVFDSLKDVEL